MSQTAQQFDFQISKEELVDILTHIEKGGLRIEFKGAEEVEGGITRLTLRHGMTAFTWGDKIVADVTANPDGSSHMNIVSSNSNYVSYGLNSKNISAIAQYIQKEISRRHDSPTSKTDAMDELIKLKKLLDAGIISEEEFQQKKEKLLRLI